MPVDAHRKIVYSASNLGENARSRFDNLAVANLLSKSFEDLAWERFPQDLLELMQLPHGVFDLLSRTRSGYGHYLPNIKMVLENGFESIHLTAKKHLNDLNNDPSAPSDEKGFYQSVCIICDAVKAFALRYSFLAIQLSEIEENPRRREELKLISAACKQVPYHPARSFHEALQSYWFTLLIDYIFQNGSAISCGRFDQFMYPFYKKDIEANKLNEIALRYQHNGISLINDIPNSDLT